MKTYWLKLTLLSDATFGRGDGLAGVVDAEVQHDRYGLPYIGGRALKGLLMEGCADILNALETGSPDAFQRMKSSAGRLFGDPGSKFESGSLHIGNAQLPADLHNAIEQKFYRIAPTSTEISAKEAHKIRERELQKESLANLESLTAIRRQTKMDVLGAPEDETLRALRVILNQTRFEARLEFLREPQPEDEALLAACIKAFRRAGSGKQRGRGRLEAALYAEDGETPVTGALFDGFKKAVQP